MQELNSIVPEYDFETIYPNEKALSSSQLLAYEKSPSDFYLKYTLGVRDEGSIPMQIGRIFSELHRERSFDYKTALAACGAPKHIAGLFERVITRFPVVPAEVALRVPHNGWEIRVTLDGFVKEQLVIIENKTGQKLWDMARVTDDDQLTLQAWAVWKLEGVLPKQIILNYVNTRAKCRKELETFKTTRTVKSLKLFQNRIDAILENIEAENWNRPIYAAQEI